MEILTAWQEWEQWADEAWSVLPLVLHSRQEKGGLPGSWQRAWEMASPYSVVLESGKGGRYTYLGLRPVSVIKGIGDTAELFSLSDAAVGQAQAEPEATELLQGQPLKVLQEWMKDYVSPRVPFDGQPPFTGGCIGFLGYDVVRSLEKLPSCAKRDPDFPDYLFMRLEELWIYDHHEDIVYCAVHVPVQAVISANRAELHAMYLDAVSRAERMLEEWQRIMVPASSEAAAAAQYADIACLIDTEASVTGEWPGMSSDFSPEQFQQAVLNVQEYIRAGDVFQVNLSLRQQAQLQSSPEDVYEWLRRLNPSPYMGLLRTPGFALSSASPELLVKLHGDKVSARPIAGTRRRGHTPAEDAAMEAELRGSEKEIAEHVMLVDLERNDIGRVAAYGTVSVPELLTVERYSHVMHLVSQVEGIAAPGKDAYDVIAALFPGGTITGAPKVRTMEIIEELEPVRRGPYTGSMGWIDYNGNMELNIIIRTLAVKDGIGYIQTGAGIVIDSDPYREYRECHNKAKAVVKAILCSERGQELRTTSGTEGGSAV
ncbi:anthranilate synthase component I family protein [Paenibacillus sp. FSL H8-0259]|uniref:anthranilate synthase component I family protein n=1 Tax=Paenibacillus sp. FSL H8-0259 TaxID=1920423 RepID=UPI00096FD22E|nr:anthranilate synthase component I family protein [Paenibacillus sp. FSL H8-0259]OMF21307.1 anthranilate synthase component I [Paenibacillus sp. FSL H8-0259]